MIQVHLMILLRKVLQEALVKNEKLPYLENQMSGKTLKKNLKKRRS
jgi:hypothetical protein